MRPDLGIALALVVLPPLEPRAALQPPLGPLTAALALSVAVEPRPRLAPPFSARAEPAAGTNAGLDRREEDGRTGRLQLFGYGLWDRISGRSGKKRSLSIAQVSKGFQSCFCTSSNPLNEIGIQ